MAMTPIGFYHSEDLDGICSGAILRHFIHDIQLVGYDYGQPFPWDKVQGRTVYMVDVSLPAKDMLRLARSAKEFIWIDHHKNPIKEVTEAGLLEEPNFQGYCATDQSGCELAWRYFATIRMNGFGLRPLTPDAVHHLGRYDVWDHRDPVTVPFHYRMRALGKHPDSAIWKKLFAGTDHSAPPSERNRCQEVFAMCVSEGEAILEFSRTENAQTVARHAFDTELDGLRVLACNHGPFDSSLFDGVWDPEKYDLMAIFGLQPGGIWRVSLRTTHDDVDVSEIAARRGGGGHPKAARFMATSMHQFFLGPHLDEVSFSKIRDALADNRTHELDQEEIDRLRGCAGSATMTAARLKSLLDATISQRNRNKSDILWSEAAPAEESQDQAEEEPLKQEEGEVERRLELGVVGV